MKKKNLENFIELKNTGFKYKLIGVITHLGESGIGGHFIAGNRSIISDLFIGLNYNITQCENCSIKSYNFETYFF